MLHNTEWMIIYEPDDTDTPQHPYQLALNGNKIIHYKTEEQAIKHTRLIDSIVYDLSTFDIARAGNKVKLLESHIKKHGYVWV